MALPLPSKLVATYFTLWGGGTRITAVPLDYNQIYLFHAVPAGGGAFSFGYGGSVNAAEIKQVQARGQRVVLTVGGANAGFNFSNRAQSDAFVASFKKMNESLGGTLDGVDFNNFEAFVGSNGAEMAYICKQLKAAYGNDFSTSCPPHPGGGYAPMDRAITKAMSDAGVLDYAGPQFYDSPDLAQQATIVSLIREWVKHLGSESKVVVGLSSNYGLQNGMGPTLATSQSVWNTLVKEFPNLRGVFAWSAQDDMGGNWNFGKTMGPLVKKGAGPTASQPSAPINNVPATPGAVHWVGGTSYKLGNVVVKDGKYYKLVNVDATGTSSGTDPIISTWYWQPTTAPVAPVVPTPPAFVVGDRVKIGANTGAITAVTGTLATVKLDTVVKEEFSKLTKL